MGFWAAKSVLLSSRPLMLVGSSLAEGLPSASGERLTSPLGPRDEARRELCMGNEGRGLMLSDVYKRKRKEPSSPGGAACSSPSQEMRGPS